MAISESSSWYLQTLALKAKRQYSRVGRASLLSYIIFAYVIWVFIDFRFVCLASLWQLYDLSKHPLVGVCRIHATRSGALSGGICIFRVINRVPLCHYGVPERAMAKNVRKMGTLKIAQSLFICDLGLGQRKLINVILLLSQIKATTIHVLCFFDTESIISNN